jgi:SAM-dependent methyltransferase
VAIYLVAAASIAAVTHTGGTTDDTILVRDRNFFGTVRVDEERPWSGTSRFRSLYSGQILHGGQFRRVDLERTPTTYYGRDSGLGLAFRHLPRRRGRHIGIVGLGVGTVAAYAKPGDWLRFYEINPMVVDLARNYFTFLRSCPCTVEFVVGDARSSLEHEARQRFDLLVLDAFSGDAIPTHLLTVEAMRIYLRHLAPSGILAVHISNLYLDLVPVLRGVAETAGLAGVLVENDEDEPAYLDAADWVLLSRDPQVLNRPAFLGVSSDRWNRSSAISWTDDFTSVARVLKFDAE